LLCIVGKDSSTDRARGKERVISFTREKRGYFRGRVEEKFSHPVNDRMSAERGEKGGIGLIIAIKKRGRERAREEEEAF